ncbi:MAG TPA: hypothetical protein PK191_08770 [Niabella sp.]|nr:hypothetical protein [Niabella sp.]HOZ98094.1 hypothetical protein [Niabella sp.]HQW16161.1 hypothetical protein [Niabella sp.]HQX21373.1 hypothetical protein [Niabella sp.]HRB36919.1 hypothetical protein [Niabella sp.]
MKTGSLVLTPFVKNAMQVLGNKIFQNPLALDQSITSHEKLLTNITQLSAQPVKVSEKQIAISPLLETVSLQPGAYFVLQWVDNRMAFAVKFNFSTKGVEEWGAFEVSADGKVWKSLLVGTSNISLPEGSHAVRFVNKSDAVQSIYLKEFSVSTKPNSHSTDQSLVFDKNPSTYSVLSPGAKIVLPLRDIKQAALVLNVFNQHIQISNPCGWKIVSDKNFVPIDLKNNPCSELEILNTGSKAIKLYEVLNSSSKLNLESKL